MLKQDDRSSGCNGQVTISSSSALQSKLIMQGLICMADIIVIGKIFRHQNLWNDDKANIFTYHNLVVEKYLKLVNSKELVVREPGGIVGNIGQEGGDGTGSSDAKNMLLFLKDNQDCTLI